MMASIYGGTEQQDIINMKIFLTILLFCVSVNGFTQQNSFFGSHGKDSWDAFLSEPVHTLVYSYGTGGGEVDFMSSLTDAQNACTTLRGGSQQLNYECTNLSNPKVGDMIYYSSCNSPWTPGVVPVITGYYLKVYFFPVSERRFRICYVVDGYVTTIFNCY